MLYVVAAAMSSLQGGGFQGNQVHKIQLTPYLFIGGAAVIMSLLHDISGVTW
jgi:hypothetical protein